MSHEVKPGPIGEEMQRGPCRFCGRGLRMYAVVDSEETVFLEHEHPWCEEYAAVSIQHGKGAEPNQRDEDEPS